MIGHTDRQTEITPLNIDINRIILLETFTRFTEKLYHLISQKKSSSVTKT